MIKDIKFSGYSASPSDYECQDGTLAASLNLICEDSHVKPLFSPKPKYMLKNRGKLLIVHKVPGQDNLIILRSDMLYWMEDPAPADGVAVDDAAAPIGQFETIHGVAVIGNTIAVASDTVQYILWKDGTYILLGSRPPFVNVEFGCQKAGTLDDEGDLSIAAREVEQTVREERVSVKLPVLGEQTDNAVYGLMLPAIAEKVTSKGYFYMPFFVRYAFRLYDGSYWWHSAPILMLPSVIFPQVTVTKQTLKDDTFTYSSKLNIPYFKLNYKVSGLGTLADWKDIISGIDVFVTAPIYTYDQSKNIPDARSINSTLLNPYFEYNPLDYVHGNSWAAPGVPDNVFIGHYAEAGSSDYVDHTAPATIAEEEDCYDLWPLPANEKFHEQIKSCNSGNFYKVASLALDALELMTEFRQLPLSSTEMDNLVTRERLSDEYSAHHPVTAKTALAYNSRLCLTDITMKPPVPFSLASSVETASPSSPPVNVQIQVFTRLNGVICHNVNTESLGNTRDMASHFPRYVYYPDSSAYKMNFIYDGQDHFVDLVPHDFLNGAYYYGSLAEASMPASFAAAETQTPEESVYMGSKVLVSEVGNPFVFQPANIVTVGSGVVFGLASAAKALSQGQFGQFPLYAFTSEGVWALEVSATGSFSARQPISRDVCIDPKSITPIDSSVLFATHRGIMLIAGSETRCISEAVNCETPFDVLALPRMDRLHKMVHAMPVSDTCLPTRPFSEFVSGCIMIYDYLHQRIFVGNPAYTYAYVFSLKSQMWGMIYSKVTDSVPSYPNAYAMQSIYGVDYNAVVDFSDTSNTGSASGLLVTRPLKLDSPDVFKTLDTAIVRGNFARGKVQTVIYGSRNLADWHLVWSSKDHYLRGFRGTPYKYFRLACVADLAEKESLFGASLQFNPRLTDQPR